MHRFATLFALVLVTGCDRGVVVPALALPAPGTAVPPFEFAIIGGGVVNADSIRGRPTVLALWSTDCGASRAALARIEAMHAKFADRGVRVVILADDTDRDELTAFVDSAALRSPVAMAGGRLETIFGLGRRSSPVNDTIIERLERQLGRRARVGFALPGFLVLDANGTVMHRSAGVPQVKEPVWDVEEALNTLSAASPVARGME